MLLTCSAQIPYFPHILVTYPLRWLWYPRPMDLNNASKDDFHFCKTISASLQTVPSSSKISNGMFFFRSWPIPTFPIFFQTPKAVFLHLSCNHPALGVDVSILSTLTTRPKNDVPPIQTKIQWNDGYSTFYDFYQHGVGYHAFILP